MNDNVTMSELYNCKEIDNPEYPLQIWYNKIIRKNATQITVQDLLKMIRQKMFSEVAVSVAIRKLIQDPFVGELSDGDLLSHLILVDHDYLRPYKRELYEIYNVAKDYDKHEWLDEGEKENFTEILPAFSMLLSKL